MLGRKPVSNGVVVAALLAVAVIGGCERASTGPSSLQGNDFAAHLVAQAGNSQSGPVNSQLPVPVTVTVTDAGGLLVSGATVVFNVRQGGGSVASLTAATNVNGVASTVWTLGAKTGPQLLVAVLSNARDSTVFSATATTGPPVQVLIISGNGQIGRSAQVLPSPLVVELRDASGNLLPGIAVNFTQGASNTDGFVSTSPINTGVDGRASVSWTLGKNVTNTTVSMSVAASPVGVPGTVATFTATARPEYRIRRDLTPFLQVDTTGATIGAPGDYLDGVRDTLRVQVYDPSDSSGVQGVSVTWAPLTAADGRVINATTVTDNKGFAKTLWSLLQAAGGPIQPSNIAKRMIATASIGQVEFQAKVNPGRICQVLQDAVVGNQTVGSSISATATVLDCNGFPVPNASVSFTASGGGSAAPSPVISNLAGQATTTWRLTGPVGQQSLTATASGKADPYNAASDPIFSASSVKFANTVPVAPASVTVTNSPPAHDPVGFAQTIVVQVKDASGNPIAGQTVTFAVTAGGGSVAPPSANTDAAGNVTVVWTLGAVAATNTLTATAGGVVATVSIITP